MPKGGSKPGERRGGRPKGGLNKTTKAVKEALVEAFEKMGGVPHFVKWGKDNPTEFYKLWAKMLPTEIKTPDGKPLQLQIVESIVDADPDENLPTPPGSTPVPA